MTRCMTAVAALLGLCVAARADYIKFVYNPAAKKGAGSTAQAAPAAPEGGGGDGGRRRPAQSTAPAAVAPKPEDELEFSTLKAEVVIEATRAGSAGVFYKYRTKYAVKPFVLIESEDVTISGNKMLSVDERYKEEKQLNPAKTAEDFVRLAEWALHHRRLEEFDKNMDQAASLDPQHRAVVAYTQLQAAMKKPVATDPAAPQWKEKLSYESMDESPHYTLLYKATVLPADVDHVKKMLEENYQAFFDWFALKGHAQSLPTKKLVVAVVNNRDDYEAQRQMFLAPPSPDDGFFARQDNLMVICTERLDPAYEALSRTTQERWKTWGTGINEMLVGHIPKGVSGLSAPDFHRDRIKAMLLKAMKEQSQLATVTNEGTQQLVGAVGLTPQGVWAPRWIQLGMASFFETPANAYWPGTGLPNWKYLPRLKALRKKDILDKPEKALRDVIIDGYFLSAHEEPEAMLKARMMSWALTYYLAQKHLDGLLKYYDELSRLPRDMAFDEPVLLGCFYRAFDLTMPGKLDEPNETKLQQFAREWYRVLEDTPMPIEEEVAIHKELKEKKTGK